MVYIRSRAETKERDSQRSKEYYRKKKENAWNSWGQSKQYNKARDYSGWQNYDDSFWKESADYGSASDSSQHHWYPKKG